MSANPKGRKSVLSRQEIAQKRKALTQKKMSQGNTGKKAIVGVSLLAVSILSLLSVATFDAKDRVGPGFKNAIGPVGHAIAEALRGLLGICAYLIPLVGLYVAGLLFIGKEEKRRWPQVVALSMLLVCGAILAQLIFKEDASWAHAPGGLVGRELGHVLTQLFSTVGTVVLVSTGASVAFIVGTQYAFLKFCGWVWAKTLVLFDKAKGHAQEFAETQMEKMEERKEANAKAKEEEAEFLAELEKEEAELSELELAANEAEEMADAEAFAARTKEENKLQELVAKERLKAEREQALLEKEAARLAREAMKTARVNQKETRQEAASILAPALLSEAALLSKKNTSVSLPLGEPAWAANMSFHQPIAPSAAVEATVAPTKRVPNIVEQPAPPVASLVDAPKSAGPNLVQMASMPPVSAQVATAATSILGSTIAPAGATALSATALGRMPLIVEPKAPPKPTKREEFQFSGGRTSFAVPPLDLLEVHTREKASVDKDFYLQTAEKLTLKLRDFGIDGEVVEIRPGPVVTMYEFKPAPGVKVSRIASLSDDLAMAMEAMRVRIVAPIPGKGVVGIEVPNKSRETVFMKEIAEQDAFQKSASKLTMCIGKDIEGMPYIFDLAKAPHLLMAGTTGSGKSVSVNAMIMSILLKSTPEEVRFIMVDPKMLELSVYEGIPHLLLPVVTDPRKAAVALQWAVDEMTRRYKLLSEAGVRNITGYNVYVEAEIAKKKAKNQVVEAKATVIKPKNEEVKASMPITESKPVEAISTDSTQEAPKKKRRMLIVDVADENNSEVRASDSNGLESPSPSFDVGVASPVEAMEDPRAEIIDEAKAAEIRVDDNDVPSEQEAAALAAAAAEASAAEAEEELKKLPFIVVIIDELADLMMVASKEVETSIARLAQMARAAGIHLMVATQRPSTDVVTGIIKANFPTRISFMLRSKPDSMTIIGTVGAEALLGMGDMLIMPPTSAHLQRVHGCYVSETEIKKVVDHLKAQGKPVFDESILKPREEEGAEEGGEDELSDELYDQALAIVGEMKNVSISMLQRKMRIGYNRSARMIERMERDGVVGRADGAKPREVLIHSMSQHPMNP
jgi:DNA segregation ATPase FtsK/SpoIIIE, S-DNA-T family